MKLLCCTLVLLSTSCGGGLGPRDESAAPAATQPQLRHLPGTWRATPDTYELLHRQGYTSPDSLFLTLAPDSTFIFAALPNRLALASGSKSQALGKPLWASGRWQVRRSGSRWEALLSVEKGKLYPEGLAANYGIAVVDSAYQLYTYIGDPDGGQQLTWTKPYRQ